MDVVEIQRSDADAMDKREGAMINRRHLLMGIPAAALMTHQAGRALAQGVISGSAPGAGKKGVMLMNRIGPSASELYIANPDGTDERKLLAQSVFDYHASYSADGKWVVFTSERTGLGQADIYRAHPDGTGLERLTDSAAVDDQAALSPDGTKVAFASTREGYKANIWILDLKTQQVGNVTGQSGIAGDPSKPGGFFRPAWSPDGRWLAFSSDAIPSGGLVRLAGSISRSCRSM
jgi:Tol biopolymer transport system component